MFGFIVPSMILLLCFLHFAVSWVVHSRNLESSALLEALEKYPHNARIWNPIVDDCELPKFDGYKNMHFCSLAAPIWTDRRPHTWGNPSLEMVVRLRGNHVQRAQLFSQSLRFSAIKITNPSLESEFQDILSLVIIKHHVFSCFFLKPLMTPLMIDPIWQLPGLLHPRLQRCGPGCLVLATTHGHRAKTWCFGWRN